MSTKTEHNALLLRQLVQNFFKGSLNFSLSLTDVLHMNWDWQQAFLDKTFNSLLLERYPISSKFTSLFLKKLIQYLEPNQEVHDDFYLKLCTAMNESNEDGFSYRHYVIGNDTTNIVTIKETRNMVVNGTTGLKTWEAALMLSDWAMCNQHIFKNKNILELGSGVGFTGITIGKLCDITSLMLTDCHDDVLKTIHNNLEINFPHLRKQEANNITLFKDEYKLLSVMMLDWNAIEDLPESIIPDVLIGADIVYDPAILQPLCNVIHLFSTRNKDLEVYIASVIRNEETFNGFLEALSNKQLAYEKIDLTKSVFIQWDETVHKCLLKIKTKLK